MRRAGYPLNHWKISCKKKELIISAGKTAIFDFREASTKEEWCNIPRKKYLKMGKVPVPKLTTRMYKPCMRSDHPSVHICPKQPRSKQARKTHKLVKSKLEKIKKNMKKRKRRKGRKRQKSIFADRRKIYNVNI